jgi:hypothetical protein
VPALRDRSDCARASHVLHGCLQTLDGRPLTSSRPSPARAQHWPRHPSRQARKPPQNIYSRLRRPGPVMRGATRRRLIFPWWPGARSPLLGRGRTLRCRSTVRSSSGARPPPCSAWLTRRSWGTSGRTLRGAYPSLAPPNRTWTDPDRSLRAINLQRRGSSHCSFGLL